MCEEIESERAGREEKDPDPDRPVRNPVDLFVVAPDLDALAFVFNLDGERQLLLLRAKLPAPCWGPRAIKTAGM